jgi:hypothetical protein
MYIIFRDELSINIYNEYFQISKFEQNLDKIWICKNKQFYITILYNILDCKKGRESGDIYYMTFTLFLYIHSYISI